MKIIIQCLSAEFHIIETAIANFVEFGYKPPKLKFKAKNEVVTLVTISIPQEDKHDARHIFFEAFKALDGTAIFRVIDHQDLVMYRTRIKTRNEAGLSTINSIDTFADANINWVEEREKYAKLKMSRILGVSL